MSNIDPNKAEEGLKMEESVLETYKDLLIVAQSNGGKLLCDLLRREIAQFIEILADTHTTMTQQEMVSTSAKISSHLTILRLITRAEQNVDSTQSRIQELEEVLKDASL